MIKFLSGVVIGGVFMAAYKDNAYSAEIADTLHRVAQKFETTK